MFRSRAVRRDLEALSRGYPLLVDDDDRWFVAQRFRLPPGYNSRSISVLVKLPRRYPMTPPGIGAARVFVPSSLRFHGQELRDLHPGTKPSFGPRTVDWAWLCYEHIDWDPHHDDLIKFLEMVRADLTDPPTN